MRLGCAEGRDGPDPRLRGTCGGRPSPALPGYGKLFSQGGGESFALKNSSNQEKLW